MRTQENSPNCTIILLHIIIIIFIIVIRPSLRVASRPRRLVMGGYLLILPMILLLFFNFRRGKKKRKSKRRLRNPAVNRNERLFPESDAVESRFTWSSVCVCVCVSRLGSFSKRAIGGGQHTFPFSLIFPDAPGGRNTSDLLFSCLFTPRERRKSSPMCAAWMAVHQNTILSVSLCLLPLVVTLKPFPSSVDSSSLSRLFIGTTDQKKKKKIEGRGDGGMPAGK